MALIMKCEWHFVPLNIIGNMKYVYFSFMECSSINMLNVFFRRSFIFDSEIFIHVSIIGQQKINALLCLSKDDSIIGKYNIKCLFCNLYIVL